jgi:hypothetical protein
MHSKHITTEKQRLANWYADILSLSAVPGARDFAEVSKLPRKVHMAKGRVHNLQRPTFPYS